MINPKSRLSLCLLPLALMLMALLASSAQAEAGAQWVVGSEDAKESPATLQIEEPEKPK